MKFKITNTTVKAVRRDNEGKDIRSATEKVGHPVKFFSDVENKREIILYQGRMTLLESISPGILNLQRGGFIKIDQIKDISVALKEHALQETAVMHAKKKYVGESKDANRKARATEMGKDTHAQKGGAEHEDAVNPDGDPNFLAKAESDKTRRQKKKVTDGTSAVGESNPTI